MNTWLKANLKFGIARVKTGRWPKKVLILSDDWGSIRLKSTNSRSKLASIGLDIKTNRFNFSDCLESNQDVERLMEILSKYTDNKGKYPVFTLVTNVGNPDFEKIRDNHFSNYFVEDLKTTYERHIGCDQVPNLFQQGISAGFFKPALHGREHVRSSDWLNFLNTNSQHARISFDEEFFFIPDEWLGSIGKTIEAPFWDEIREDTINEKLLIEDAMARYMHFFGETADYFTPPALLFNKMIPNIAASAGLKWFDVPRNYNTSQAALFRESQSKKAPLNLVVRNIIFDPNIPNGSGNASACLYQMEQAFKYNQPAILSNHRVSFVGGIEEKNAIHGLTELDKLLSLSLKRWPDIEFCGVEGLKRD
jgi:hypothetical protein